MKNLVYVSLISRNKCLHFGRNWSGSWNGLWISFKQGSKAKNKINGTWPKKRNVTVSGELWSWSGSWTWIQVKHFKHGYNSQNYAWIYMIFFVWVQKVLTVTIAQIRILSKSWFWILTHKSSEWSPFKNVLTQNKHWTEVLEVFLAKMCPPLNAFSFVYPEFLTNAGPLCFILGGAQERQRKRSMSTII